MLIETFNLTKKYPKDELYIVQSIGYYLHKYYFL